MTELAEIFETDAEILMENLLYENEKFIKIYRSQGKWSLRMLNNLEKVDTGNIIVIYREAENCIIE
ncbi:MAG: hypothetical protein LBR26_17270 [Prevotella sp.]|jgi:hypothetical protein|nr:hypothetical protein [Prevotella sp.]